MPLFAITMFDLRRAMTIDEVRRSFSPDWRRRKIRYQILAAFPRRKQRLNSRHYLIVMNVADDDEHRRCSERCFAR